MALFLVVALEDDGAAVDAAVLAKVPVADCYKIENGKIIVDVPGIATSKELSSFLGLISEQSHFIVPVRGYFGRSRPDLWEWLAAKTSKANV